MQMQKASCDPILSLLIEYRNTLHGIEKKIQKHQYQLSTICSTKELPYMHIRFQKILENVNRQEYICERIAAQLT